MKAKKWLAVTPLSLAWVLVHAEPPQIAENTTLDVIKSVESLLDDAAKAVQTQNYSGRFTYEFGNILETLEVVHTVKDGVESERILHLSGKKREFVRHSRSARCLTVGALLLRGETIIERGAGQKLSNNYLFYIGTDERVAGRETTTVQIVPRDEFRYGLTLAFDKRTGLPLLTILNNTKHTLERFQFVELTTGDEVLVSELAPTDGPFQTLDSKQLTCLNRAEERISVSSPWSARWVPPGFVLAQAESNAHYEAILTYTDGLAAFTVFVSSLSGVSAESIKSGAARRGATLAMIHKGQFEGSMKVVALVGEIPLAAAQKVLESIRPSA